MPYNLVLRFDDAALKEIKEYILGSIEQVEEEYGVKLVLDKLHIQVTNLDSNQISIAFWGKTNNQNKASVIEAIEDFSEVFAGDFGDNSDEMEIEEYVPHFNVADGEFVFGATMHVFPADMPYADFDTIGFQGLYDIT